MSGGYSHADLHRVAYLRVFGHPYGLCSAVLNFNRLPTLLTAVVRRITSVLDLGLAGSGWVGWEAQVALRQIGLLGRELSHLD